MDKIRKIPPMLWFCIFAVILIVIAKLVIGNEADIDTEQRELSAKNELRAAGVISTDYREFDDDFRRLTDIQKDVRMTSFDGKLVQWTGKIVDVKDGKIELTGGVINAVDFVAYMKDDYKDRLMTLDKGSTVTVRGKLKRTAWPWWEIREAEFR